MTSPEAQFNSLPPRKKDVLVVPLSENHGIIELKGKKVTDFPVPENQQIPEPVDNFNNKGKLSSEKSTVQKEALLKKLKLIREQAGGKTYRNIRKEKTAKRRPRSDSVKAEIKTRPEEPIYDYMNSEDSKLTESLLNRKNSYGKYMQEKHPGETLQPDIKFDIKKILSIIDEKIGQGKTPLFSEIIKDSKKYEWKGGKNFTPYEKNILSDNDYVKFDIDSIEELGPKVYGPYLNWILENKMNKISPQSVKMSEDYKGKPLSKIVEDGDKYKWKDGKKFTDKDIDLLEDNKYVKFDRKSIEKLGPEAYEVYGPYLNWIKEKNIEQEQRAEENINKIEEKQEN